MQDIKPMDRVTLPKFCYLRGSFVWFRFKEPDGKWRSYATHLEIDRLDEAGVVATEKHREVWGAGGEQSANSDVMTVQTYGLRWLEGRKKRGLPSTPAEESILRLHIIPRVGGIPLTGFKPLHARTLVRDLCEVPEDARLAPRTIRHVFELLHRIFQSAIIEELIYTNPVRVERGELPPKIDADPEWRAQATYTRDEIEQLISDPRIPPERRVLYAIKAMTGTRHGEAVAMAWRHIDRTVGPLPRINIVRSWSSKQSQFKRTKTQDLRSVPLHPTLDRMLTAWKVAWVKVYGREPAEDDLIAPARTNNPVNQKDAGEALTRDLTLLGLRLLAGTTRQRGGHDIRAWYQTQCIEDGAMPIILRRTTHAKPGDVADGYERFSWASICNEVSKLRIELPKDPLSTDTTYDSKRHDFLAAHPTDEQVFAPPPQKPQPNTDCLKLVERALLQGDTDLALAVVRRMRKANYGRKPQQASGG